VGTGFDERELGRVMALLKPLEIKEPPFVERPAATEGVHWVRPQLVAQVKFTEWTADGHLRHPVYLGLRDDKKPGTVVREGGRTASRNPEPGPPDLLAQLHALEAGRRDGVLALPNGQHLSVTNLHKVFWPEPHLTKGDLFRYYVQVAPFLLPVLADRPLVLKRYPNGVTGTSFYQHRAPDDVPEGVRVEAIERPQIVGGDLFTLLFTTQRAALSQDPWFSRVGHVDAADHVALDLDPPPGAPFARVLDVARWIHDELDAMGATGAPKTSGADGLHIYIPLPPGTPYDAGLLFCQIVATVVAQKHPKAATLERSIRARGTRVYIDCLQNAAGKTLASAYSARASEFAGVSTPVTWREVEEGIDRRDFTITSVPGRLKRMGDLWSALRESKGVDLARAARRAEKKL
jgi:bifunctional non-homologous end joining protein LigD